MTGVEVEGIDPHMRKRLGTTESKAFGELFEGWYERQAYVDSASVALGCPHAAARRR